MKVRRQFWFGMLAGLTLGSAPRHMTRGGFRQASIERTYCAWAKVYDLASVYMFGHLEPMRHAAMERLQLRLGDSVLEVSCGTGANFALVEEQIGPSGRLVGIDYTPSMLAEAEEQVRQDGWYNIELIRADATELDLDKRFDAVLWVLAASVVPRWEDALAVDEQEVYLIFQVHNEAIAIPENIDCIRALTGLESDGARSIAMTNEALGVMKSFLPKTIPEVAWHAEMGERLHAAQSRFMEEGFKGAEEPTDSQPTAEQRG